MSFRAYLLFMGVSTIIAWLAWVVLLLNIDPTQASLFVFIIFYFTLAVGLIGTISLLSMAYRVLVVKQHDLIIRQVRVAFRHAVLLSSLAVISLALSASGLFHWWVLVVLIVGASMIEYVSLLIQSSRRS
ncbi:hypothetical protein KBC54_03880 [Patescibacteria group bacterium]|nr:hypothetical protein [Patescibacteria group bacterium]